MGEQDILLLAAEIGYSQTTFAVSGQDGCSVHYFSPEAEVFFVVMQRLRLVRLWLKTTGTERMGSLLKKVRFGLMDQKI